MKLLRESLPEIIGGLIVAAILAILASLYSLLGPWVVPAIIGILVLAIIAWIALSRRKRNLPSKSELPNSKAISSPSQTGSIKPTILFVDDDIEVIGSGFVVPLEKQGFEVVAATNASQALQVIESNQRLDLIVTDLILPYGGEKRGASEPLGLEVIETARKLRGKIPIVCLSVSRDKEIGQRLRELGVNEHLSKPIRPSEFIERVKLALLMSYGPPQQDLILDEIRRRKLEIKSGNPYSRIRALWTLGELGHYDSTVLGLLESIAQNDDDEDVRSAANEALDKIRAKSSG